MGRRPHAHSPCRLPLSLRSPRVPSLCVCLVALSRGLACQSLDEFIYLLLDHGYDDLSSIAECDAGELAELVQLFTTPDSKKAISSMVAALREVGIGQSPTHTTFGRDAKDEANQVHWPHGRLFPLCACPLQLCIASRKASFVG